MKKRKLLSLLVLLMTAVSGAWASIGGSGTQGDPWTISSAADWNEFCASFDTKNYADQYVKLTCNIPTADEVNAGTQAVTQMAAETYQGNYFKGTFDGGNNTIKVNIGASWEKHSCGVFRYLDGATVKNLKVDGNIGVNGFLWRGSIAGVTYGNCTIENCTSWVAIDDKNYIKNTNTGGFVGYALGNITFTNCVFMGSFTGVSSNTWGGFVGQKDNDAYTITLNKCLFAPNTVNVGATGSATFVCTDDADGVSFGTGDDGAYCTQFLGTQQGTLASTTAPTAENGIYKSATVNSDNIYVVATVSGIEDEYIADGSSHTLTPVLTCMGSTLTKGIHYTIADETKLTYTNAGNYNVTFNAKEGSEYSGSCTVSYKVVNPSGNCGENVTWSLNLSSGVLTISGSGAMADYGEAGDQPWAAMHSDIKTIVIEDGVTRIGKYAFSNCEYVTSVSIPASVTSIGNFGFFYCTGMSSLTIAENSSLKTIGSSAFYCAGIESITIPASVTSIGSSAFDCSHLTTATLNSNPSIGRDSGTDAFPSTTAVTMNLTANAAGGANWMTFYNENYNFQADANTQIFKAALSGTTLELTKLTTDKIVNKDNAVILKSTASPIVMTLTTTDSNNDFTGNSLQGVNVPAGKTEVGPSTTYVLNYKDGTGVGFYKLATGSTVGVGKAYLTYSAGAREFFGFGEATGISATLNDNVEMINDNVYDLQGRRVQNPSKGLYIVNGKKVVIK